MPDAIDQALDFVLAHEGGHVCDPTDPGGETKFGISKRTYPDLDIAGLTKERAREILARDYWDELRLGRLPAPLALVLMDTAVNLGRGRATKLLQAAFNQLAVGAGLLVRESGGRRIERLRVDGVLGSKTEQAVVTWCGPLWAAAPCRAYYLAADVLFRRLAWYLRLDSDRFLEGWARRVAALHETVRKAAEFTAV